MDSFVSYNEDEDNIIHSNCSMDSSKANGEINQVYKALLRNFPKENSDNKESLSRHNGHDASYRSFDLSHQSVNSQKRLTNGHHIKSKSGDGDGLYLGRGIKKEFALKNSGPVSHKAQTPGYFYRQLTPGEVFLSEQSNSQKPLAEQIRKSWLQGKIYKNKPLTPNHIDSKAQVKYNSKSAIRKTNKHNSASEPAVVYNLNESEMSGNNLIQTNNFGKHHQRMVQGQRYYNQNISNNGARNAINSVNSSEDALENVKNSPQRPSSLAIKQLNNSNSNGYMSPSMQSPAYHPSYPQQQHPHIYEQAFVITPINPPTPVRNHPRQKSSSGQQMIRRNGSGTNMAALQRGQGYKNEYAGDIRTPNGYPQQHVLKTPGYENGGYPQNNGENVPKGFYRNSGGSFGYNSGGGSGSSSSAGSRPNSHHAHASEELAYNPSPLEFELEAMKISYSKCKKELKKMQCVKQKLNQLMEDYQKLNQSKIKLEQHYAKCEERQNKENQQLTMENIKLKNEITELKGMLSQSSHFATTIQNDASRASHINEEEDYLVKNRQLEEKNRQLSDEVVECRERMNEQQEQIKEMKFSSDNTQYQISHLEAMVKKERSYTNDIVFKNQQMERELVKLRQQQADANNQQQKKYSQPAPNYAKQQVQYSPFEGQEASGEVVAQAKIKQASPFSKDFISVGESSIAVKSITSPDNRQRNTSMSNFEKGVDNQFELEEDYQHVPSDEIAEMVEEVRNKYPNMFPKNHEVNNLIGHNQQYSAPNLSQKKSSYHRSTISEPACKSGLQESLKPLLINNKTNSVAKQDVANPEKLNASCQTAEDLYFSTQVLYSEEDKPSIINEKTSPTSEGYHSGSPSPDQERGSPENVLTSSDFSQQTVN